MKNAKANIFTVPNLLSVLRIALIPLFVQLYLSAETAQDYTVAAVVIALSGLTDLIDGKIARRFNQISEVGKVLDPVADKLTQAAIILCLTQRYRVFLYLFILFAVKELTMGVISLVLLIRKQKLDGAMWFGKVATMVFYLCSVVLIALPRLPMWAVNAMSILTGAVLLFAFVSYLQAFHQMFIKAKQVKGEKTV